MGNVVSLHCPIKHEQKRFLSFSLSLHNRSNGMRTLENSSSSEEEDRADLLGRNFQVPRPKSRSNASITVKLKLITSP